MIADPNRVLPLNSFRQQAVNRLMDRSPAGWTDEQIEDELNKLETVVWSSLGPDLQKALQTAEDDQGCRSFEVAVKKALRSKELLRFKPIKNWTKEKNTSAETIFEKKLAEDVENLPGWATQIPIWSGIRGNGGKCNVDIGYLKGGIFNLYELKIGPTNDPPYAICEVMTYVMGYLLVRKLAAFAVPEKREEIRAQSHGLLEARSIEWSVLAPREFYNKKSRGGVRLRPEELEQLRRIAERCIQRTAENLNIKNLRIALSLRCLNCEMPSAKIKDEEDGKKWIRQIKGTNTLRSLISDAPKLSSF